MLSPVNGAQMNSFIVTTKEGNVIVIDGGYRCDAEKLLGKLREITGKDIPHIDAWFLTHPHNDHVDAFIECVENRREEFTYSRVYFSFPSIQFMERNENIYSYTIKDIYKAFPLFADHYESISTGDTYVYGSAELHILYTHNGLLSMNAGNNASTIFRLTLGGKTVMFLADAGVEEGELLLKEYGATLKSDYCQMAHHGQNGVERDVYEAISPEACFWCAPQWLYDNDGGKGFDKNIWKTVTVRRWMEEMGVRTNYVIKDGDIEVEF